MELASYFQHSWLNDLFLVTVKKKVGQIWNIKYFRYQFTIIHCHACYSIERLCYTLIGYWWLYVAHDWFSMATLDDAVPSFQWKLPERWFKNFNINVFEKCVFKLICSLFIRVVILKKITSDLQGFSLFDDQNPQLTKYCIFYRIFLPMVIPVNFSYEWEWYYLPNVKHNFFKPCNNYDNPCSI
jgi:hypothetical protein